MSTRTLGGIIPAIVTPMKADGSVDVEAMEGQVDYLSRSGVHGFFVNGTTSEGPVLSRAEKKETVRLVKRVSAGRQAVCAACIAPSAGLVVEEIREIEELEPDFIVAVAPFYYSVSQADILDHYRQICASTSIPVIFYDIPHHTHNPIAIQTRFRLVESGLGVGFKDSTGDFKTFSQCVLSSPSKDFVWIQGDDLLDACSLLLGAKGVVTGLSNITPVPYVELFASLAAGDTAGLIAAQRKINALAGVIPAAGGRVVAGIKAAVSHLTGCDRRLRLGTQTATEEEAVAVRRVVEKLPDLRK